MTVAHVLPPLLLALFAAGSALAHGGGGAALPVPPELAPAVARPGDGLAIGMKFAEMFRMPIGPLGLEPSARLLALEGRRVRLVGYMASVETRMTGRLILTPMPVSLGDEDESLSNDLPASAVFVHLSGKAAQQGLPNLEGLLQLAGTLRLGACDEPGGHVSAIRLVLDERDSRRLVDGVARAGARLSTQNTR